LRAFARGATPKNRGGQISCGSGGVVRVVRVVTLRPVGRKTRCAVSMRETSAAAVGTVAGDVNHDGVIVDELSQRASR
jgi:hypothetical protein